MSRTQQQAFRKILDLVLEKRPEVEKLICWTRIFTGMNKTGAYTRLGNIQLRQQRYDSAAQYYRQAIRLDTSHHEPYENLAHALIMNPQSSATESGNEQGLQKNQSIGITPQRDWKSTSFGFLKNQEEFCACFDRAIARNPLDLTVYQKYYDLFGLGEFKLAEHYFRRSLQAQSLLARERQVKQPGLRYLRQVWTYNIGHIIGLDTLSKMQLLGWQPPQKTVLLAAKDRIANRVYLECFRPLLDEVITDPEQIQKRLPEAECLEEFPMMLRVQGNLVMGHHVMALVNEQWERENRAPLATLRAEEMERGRARLRQLGVPESAWFVGLHVRGKGFHQNDRIQDFRNPSIESYEQAIRSVTARGGWVIRMGDPNMAKLKPMAQVVDYAHSDLRCDWMDVFLCAAIRFMIGTQSGLSHVPHTFGVPSVLTNWTSVGLFPWFARDIFIPQLFWVEKEKCYLSIEQILSSGLGFVQTGSLFAQKGVRLVANSPEDINDAVVEMLDRMDAQRAVNPVDDSNRKIKKIAEAHGALCLCQMGSSFLKKHPFLLAAED